jgi:small subunit ribosomal protein S18
MVKRVKDMTVSAPADSVKADSRKILSDVASIDTLVSIDTESSEERGGGRHGQQAMVPESCPICDMKISKHDIKYYDVALLKKFMSVRGKIIPRIKSGVCSAHQRALKTAINRARFLALLPYVDTGMQV